MAIDISVSGATQAFIAQILVPVLFALFDLVMAGAFIRRWIRATVRPEREKWGRISVIYTSFVLFQIALPWIPATLVVQRQDFIAI